MCAKNKNIYAWRKQAIAREIVTPDFYCCLLPQCEALHTCRSGFPITTIASSKPGLQNAHDWFWAPCDHAGMKICTKKTMVLCLFRKRKPGQCMLNLHSKKKHCSRLRSSSTLGSINRQWQALEKQQIDTGIKQTQFCNVWALSFFLQSHNWSFKPL